MGFVTLHKMTLFHHTNRMLAHRLKYECASVSVAVSLLAGQAGAQSPQQLADLSLEELDLSVRWQVADNWHVTTTGQNLTDSGHAEFGPALYEMERAAFLKIAWSP